MTLNQAQAHHENTLVQNNDKEKKQEAIDYYPY